MDETPLPQPTDTKSLNRKYRMTMFGLIGVLAVFATTGIAQFINPTIAAPLFGLATVVITAIGALVSVYSGSQAAVDWKSLH